MWNMVFLGTGAVFLALLFVVLFSKKRINSEENKYFKTLLIANGISYVIEITLQMIVRKIGIYNPLVDVFVKLYLVSIFTWFTFFSIYTFIVCLNKKDENKYIKKFNNIRNINLIIWVIGLLVLFSLPFEKYYELNEMYAYGIAVDALKLFLGSYMLVWLILLITNLKKLKDKKYLPIFLVLLCIVIMVIIQTINPSILITNMVGTFICYAMYFTIENPDMKLLQELHNSKEISDNANEEKTLFIYNLTQDIRNISNAIDDDADYILDSKNLDETYECARNIKFNSAKFITMTNEILDISQVDSSNIKTHNNKYSIKNILKQIINVYGDLCKNKDLKFITNIDHDVPEILYGDGIGLKEVLTTILNNSVKYTNKGFIELNINTIIKNEICRLIITIEDSGIGIKSEDINNIKNSDTSLSQANKLITLMHGAMLISSSYGLGTKIKIILDQKMEVIKNPEIDKYNEIIDNIKVLAVDDSEAGLKIIEKLLKGTKINLTKATTGKECIDKIKVNKYDLILLDEELSQITANELILKIKEIRNFNVPVVLLTKDNSYEYNEEYLKQGFVGYIIKPLKKEIFIQKIIEYSKRK